MKRRGVEAPIPAAATILLLVVIGVGCSATMTGFHGTFVATPVEKVALHDTMDQVRARLGKPRTMTRGLTEDGRERVIWRYGTLQRKSRSIGATAQTAPPPVSFEQGTDVTSLGAGEFLVVFIDGRVADVVRP